MWVWSNTTEPLLENQIKEITLNVTERLNAMSTEKTPMAQEAKTAIDQRNAVTPHLKAAYDHVAGDRGLLPDRA